jgi:thioredoxin reductase (NADPH)
MNKIENIAIIGSGPAAYTACLYTEEYEPIMFEGGMIGNNGPGGQLTTTTNVDNYPGFPNGIQGPDLIEKMRSQIKNKVISETVTKIYKIQNSYFKIVTENDNIFYSKSVIIATGASARRLFVPGTNDGEYWQKGVSSCAVCDGWAFLDKTVIVIGGGDSAIEEALYLSSIAKEVILVHRRENFRARPDMLRRAINNSKIKIMTPFELDCVKGNEKEMTHAFLRNKDNKKLVKVEADGLFFGIGHDPNVEFLNKANTNLYLIYSDVDGHLIANEDCITGECGVFCCGDVQDNKYRQAITAAGSGCRAALAAIEYLKTLI